MASRRDVPRSKTSGTGNPSVSAGSKSGASPVPKRAAPTKSQSRASSGATATSVSAGSRDGRSGVSNEVRYRMISEAAYWRAEQRGFAPGGEVEDWLAAEQEVDRLLAAEHVPGPQ